MTETATTMSALGDPEPVGAAGRDPLLESRMIGAAACLLAVVAAWEAQAQNPRPENGRVRVCASLGAGFLSIPNTDTCMRLSGYARAQAFIHEGGLSEDFFDGDPFVIVGRRTENSRYRSLAQGEAILDARTRTEFGTLRTSVGVSGATDETDDEKPFELDRAFVELRGFTAGLAPSFFTLENPVDYLGTHITDFAEDVILAGYTAKFGKDLSASFAVESGELPDEVDGIVDYVRLRGPGTRDLVDQRGQDPAAVAKLLYEPSWGSMQVSGAVQRTRPRLFAENGSFEAVKERTGWALGGGVAVELPRLGDGDEAVVNLSYSRGLSFYTAGIGSVVWTDLNRLQDVDVFGLFAGYVHQWTPQWRSNFGFSLTQAAFNVPAVKDRARGITATGNLIWSPVRDLELGMELIYAHVDADRAAAGLLDVARRPEGALSVVVQVERRFGR